MYYMYGKDKKIQEQMKSEGKIKISNFNDMVKNYFKNKYNVNGYFEFLYVEYKFFDENHQVYNLDIGQYVSRPENRKVRTMLPFFIEPNSIDDIRTFSLNIPGIIDINNLNPEILRRLPKGVKFITDNEIKEILFNAGYEEPFFDHYFYSTMDYPNYNLYAKPTIKKHAINTQIADNDDNIKSCFNNEITREEIKNTIISSDKPILIKTRNDNRVEEWLKKVFSCTMKDRNHLNYMDGSEFNEYINSCYSNDSELSTLVITDIDAFRFSDLAYIWSIINDDNFPKNSKTIFVQKSKYDSLAEVLPVIPESLVTTIDITGEQLTIKNYEPKINGRSL